MEPLRPFTPGAVCKHAHSRIKTAFNLLFAISSALCHLLAGDLRAHALAGDRKLFLDRYYMQGLGMTTLMRSTAFAPIPVILLNAAIGIVVLVGLALSFLRLDSGIPVASNCSAAISAACHPPPEDEDAALGLVQWGAVSSDEQGVGHCSFSSRPVQRLEQGKSYAGYQF